MRDCTFHHCALRAVAASAKQRLLFYFRVSSPACALHRHTYRNPHKEADRERFRKRYFLCQWWWCFGARLDERARGFSLFSLSQCAQCGKKFSAAVASDQKIKRTPMSMLGRRRYIAERRRMKRILCIEHLIWMSHFSKMIRNPKKNLQNLACPVMGGFCLTLSPPSLEKILTFRLCLFSSIIASVYRALNELSNSSERPPMYAKNPNSPVNAPL